MAPAAAAAAAAATNEANTSALPTTHVPPQPDDELPSNIQHASQLPLVPQECLSGIDSRPLLHVDERGNHFHYSLQPMSYSVCFILIVELLERFSFYGYYYTLTLFLTGAYNEDWNAGFASITAASYVSTSTMVAYSTPFVGAFLADTLWGDYKSILFGLLCFYVPGVLLMTLTSVPGLLGEEFSVSLLTLSLLVLWPMGTGCLKSLVNVFGAKQFHPLLQSSMIESYYVNFYMAINVGALCGIGSIPILAQRNVTLAYSWPLGLLVAGVVVFVAGTPRYVRSPPRSELWSSKTSKVVRRTDRNKNKHPSTTSLVSVFRICLLIVPFAVGYNQMPTTFIVQGTVMTKAFGVIDVASMNTLDALSVLFFGSVTATYMYPSLSRRGIKLRTTHKFAIGSAFGALAICWALIVECMIHHAYQKDGSQISVLWQAPAYVLIGWGEIFAISSAYEVAFTASSPDKKALASAVNIFCVGGLPNLLCILLYQSCRAWFTNTRGTTELTHLRDYSSAKIGHYFLVLLGIMVFGVLVNLLPAVRDFVSLVEEEATELVRTPMIRKPAASFGQRDHGGGSMDESSPLLLTPGAKQYQDYLKYGQEPLLHKMGSMRAGPSLSHLKGTKPGHIKYKYVPKLYNKADETPRVIARGSDGESLTVGSLEEHAQIGRLNSA